MFKIFRSLFESLIESDEDEPNDLVFYENCNGNTKLHGEKLNSIIGYVMSQLSASDDEDSGYRVYTKYCEALENKFESSEPYIKSITLNTYDRDRIVGRMKDLLPKRIDKFNKLIDKVADNAVAVLHTDPRDISELIYRQDTKEFNASEFTVLKVFKSGENLEITACYMYVRGKHSKQRYVIFTSESTEASMTYRQKTFTLNTTDLKKIIEKAKKSAQSRW